MVEVYDDRRGLKLYNTLNPLVQKHFPSPQFKLKLSYRTTGDGYYYVAIVQEGSWPFSKTLFKLITTNNHILTTRLTKEIMSFAKDLEKAGVLRKDIDVSITIEENLLGW